MTAEDNNVVLREIVRKMDAAATLTLAAAESLSVEVETARLLAVEDRAQIARLIVLVRRLIEQADLTFHGTRRLEQTAVHVAQDLAESIQRADAAPVETPGAGADAALRSPGLTAAESHQEP